MHSNHHIDHSLSTRPWIQAEHLDEMLRTSNCTVSVGLRTVTLINWPLSGKYCTDLITANIQYCLKPSKICQSFCLRVKKSRVKDHRASSRPWTKCGTSTCFLSGFEFATEMYCYIVCERQHCVSQHVRARLVDVTTISARFSAQSALCATDHSMASWYFRLEDM